MHAKRLLTIAPRRRVASPSAASSSPKQAAAAAMLWRWLVVAASLTSLATGTLPSVINVELHELAGAAKGAGGRQRLSLRHFESMRGTSLGKEVGRSAVKCCFGRKKRVLCKGGSAYSSDSCMYVVAQSAMCAMASRFAGKA